MMSTRVAQLILSLWLATLLAGCGSQTAGPGSHVAQTRPGISAGGKGPVADFEDVMIDLGDVSLNSSRDHLDAVIRVRNAGDEPLAFQRLVMSCGCTAAKPAQQQIEPGETGEIDVRIEVTTSGSRTVSVTAHSNTVGRPHTTVNIRWNAVAPIEVKPDAVDFGEITPGAAVEQTVELVQSKFGECATSQITIDPTFQSSHALTVDWSNPLLLRLRLTAGSKPGNFTEFVPLQLTDCWRDSIRIPVRWQVQPLVSLASDVIFVSTVKAGETLEKAVIVKTTEPRIELPVVEPAPESADSTSVVTGLQWQRVNEQTMMGTLMIKAPDAPGAFHELVAIPVSLPVDTPPLELRVSGFVVARSP